MSLIAKRLKDARLQTGLSQERLGVLAGIDELTASARMNQYERGKHVPALSMVARLAKVLGVPMAYFYIEDDEMAALFVAIDRLKKGDQKKVAVFVKQLMADYRK